MGRDLALRAYACQSSLKAFVQTNFPQEEPRWPLLRGFNFEGYTWEGYLIVILRDRPSDTSSGESVQVLEDSDVPPEKPRLSNVDLWQSYLRSKFSVRSQDFVAITQYVEDAEGVKEEYAQWSEENKKLYRRQVEINVAHQLKYLEELQPARVSSPSSSYPAEFKALKMALEDALNRLNALERSNELLRRALTEYNNNLLEIQSSLQEFILEIRDYLTLRRKNQKKKKAS